MVLSLRMYLKKKYVLPYEEINIIDVRQCSQKHAINFILSPIKVNYRQLFLERSYVTLIKNLPEVFLLSVPLRKILENDQKHTI